MDARAAAGREADRAARTSYGKLLAILAARSGDIAGAEDSLAEAFASALATWPLRGIPASPEAWLLTAARRTLGHARGRRATAAAGEEALDLLQAELAGAEPELFGDARLRLLLVCTHPAIAPDVQAPLMLQAVLGLDAGRIAGCFLVSPGAVGQKLVRAKAKIRDAGIPFALPEPGAVAGRIGAVLSAIYAAYGTGWEDVFGADPKRCGLAVEAVWLGRLVAALLPDTPEALGLLALMLHCEARRAARRDAAQRFVPLRRQNVSAWSRPMIQEAEALLRAAARHGAPGRFQTEAAIQSLHVHQRLTGERFGDALVQLYDVLVAVAPSIGAQVARAAAYGDSGHPAAALDLLDASPGCEGYQPWWAARARALWLMGDPAGADAAAARAAALSSDPSVRAFLSGGGLFTA